MSEGLLHPDEVPAASRRVMAAGRDRGVEVDVYQFPQGTKTSRDAATAVGCPLGAITKSLVFMVDGDPVVALMPGDRRLDPAKLGMTHGGGEARRATLEEVRRATGFAAGGTPPFGHEVELSVYADPALREHPQRWAAAGTPATVFPISLDQLIEASGAVWADLAE